MNSLRRLAVAVVVISTLLPVVGQAQTPPGFVDVLDEVGLDGPLHNSYVHAASWGDIDGDDVPDLFVGTFVQGPTQVPDKLFTNGYDSFVDLGQSSVEVSGRAAASVVVDLDGDGDSDLLISNNTKPGHTGAAAEPSRLLRNDDGVFVDVTVGSGLDSQAARGRQAGVLDYDGDGQLDLFIVADSFGGDGNSVLLRGLGDMRFEDVTAAAGIPEDLHGLGLAVGDLTGNGWPDIFVAGGADLGEPNHNYLLVARGDGTYRNISDHNLSWAPYTSGNEDWVSSGAIADLNRDGRLDLLVGHHFGSSSEHGDGASLRVYLNRGTSGGIPELEDVTDQLGLPRIDSKAPHVAIEDFDNDGWPDLYTSVTVDGQPLIFFHQGLSGGEPHFDTPSPTEPHYYPVGPVADFDGDGSLDIFLGEFRSVLQGGPDDVGVVPSRLMRNELDAGNWLEISVPGPTSGIGSTVDVYRNGKAGQPGALLGSRLIQVGNGFSSASLPAAHFGLGGARYADVVVTPPHGGTPTILRGVIANRRVQTNTRLPELEWHLDEGAGAKANDTSGRGNDGKIVGGATWARRAGGPALRLAGDGGRIRMPGRVLRGATDLTISAWIAPEARRRQTVLSAANADEASSFDIRLVRRRHIVVEAGSNKHRWAFPRLRVGRWNHIAVVRDSTAGTLTLYLNGESLGAKKATTRPLRVSRASWGADQDPAGNYAATHSWLGRIDEVVVYRAALDATVLAP